MSRITKKKKKLLFWKKGQESDALDGIFTLGICRCEGVSEDLGFES